MLKIEMINYDSIEVLLNMYREKSKWLEDTGKPMWNMEYLQKETFIMKYNEPECFVAYIEDIPMGGFVLVENDDMFWSDYSHFGVYYIHKLVVKKGYTGKGYALQILNWVGSYAKSVNRQKLRLDCFEDRDYLLKLYSSCGFNLERVKVMPDGIRIAQFEKSL